MKIRLGMHAVIKTSLIHTYIYHFSIEKYKVLSKGMNVKCKNKTGYHVSNSMKEAITLIWATFICRLSGHSGSYN